MNEFVKNVAGAKIETERKMRNDLDDKILTARIERLNFCLGENCMKRLKYYIKAFKEERASEGALR